MRRPSPFLASDEEEHVLYERLEDAWRVRQRCVPISVVLTFAPEGLVLGAGTVLLKAEGERRLKSLKGEGVRVLTKAV